MNFTYADPPYPGQSKKHYGDHEDYAGEVDHFAMCREVVKADGWAISTSAPALFHVQQALAEIGYLPMDPETMKARDYRVMAWVKPFCAFKRNVKVAYSWEPVLVKPVRRPEPNNIEGLVLRDHIAENITMKRGLTGAKPEKVCWWMFEAAGLDPEDDLLDMYPGSGAVTAAHETWRAARSVDTAATLAD